MRPSVKSALANAALVLVSVSLTYLAASFLIFRFFLPDLSLNLRPHFPDLAEVFAQTSKAGYVPHDYIALLGDSYAEGQGDGLLAANGDRAKVFHSAHVLHRATTRDVVSLGIGGAGSAQAMVRMPTRVLRDRCFVYPVLEAPRQMLVYFYEGNDLDENGYVVNMAAQTYGAPTRETIARYIETRYARLAPLRCYTEFAETTVKMARFLTNRHSFETLRKPSAHNKVLAGGGAYPAPALQKPPFELPSAGIENALMVFDISLAWLKRNFPDSTITMVYLPSPAAIYRHADETIDTYTDWPLNTVRTATVGDIDAASQRTCEQIRTLTMAQGVRFLDLRPALRAAGTKQLIHGPRDWNHFNEAGYRVLGATLVQMLDDTASTACRDWDARP
jgi:GDSL-like lipase/acylhydrolase family protein